MPLGLRRGAEPVKASSVPGKDHIDKGWLNWPAGCCCPLSRLHLRKKWSL